jgi:hypothetical protein
MCFRGGSGNSLLQWALTKHCASRGYLMIGCFWTALRACEFLRSPDSSKHGVSIEMAATTL